MNGFRKANYITSLIMIVPRKKYPPRQENIQGHGHIVIISALTLLREGLCQTLVT